MIHIAGRHIRAGRKLLGWTAGQLAREAAMPLAEIVSLEDDRLGTWGEVDRVARVLGQAGVTFLRLEDCGRSGVALAGAVPLGGYRKRRRSGSPCPSSRAIRAGIEQRRMIDAGCGLLKWRRSTLVRAAGLKKSAIDAAWRNDGPLPSWMADALFRALRRAGVIFRHSDLGGGPAVALVGRAAWHGYGVLWFVGHGARGWE